MSDNKASAPDAVQKPAAATNGSAAKPAPAPEAAHHPSGKAGHGPIVKFLRGLSFAIYFITCSVT